jgi:hypothetical protein
MLENLLGNLEDAAAKFGLPADQIKSLAESVSGKLGQGGDPMAALMEAAQQHGISADSVQQMLGGLGGAEGLLGKVGNLLGGAEGDSPADMLGGLAKGLFGKD